MKTIKQAANYADKYFEERLGNTGARNGFIAGVEFAQRWISVEDEKPGTASESGTIILMDGNSFVGMGFFDKKMEFHFLAPGRGSLIGHANVTFTHWRKIHLE